MTATKDTTYNGWSNYETWNVKLWIGNEEGSYRYWQEQAQMAYDDAILEILGDKGSDEDDEPTAEDKEKASEAAALALRETLKEEITDSAPDLGATMFADLLGAALSEVNWYEITTNLIEDVDK